MSILALLRHGQSLYNLENRFTGWADIPLTEQGRREAARAADALKDVPFDMVVSSRLDRTVETGAFILQRLKLDVPVLKDSALNERNYGDIQGLNKEEIAAKYGEEQVHLWRRDYFTRPPNGESLEDCERRTLPFFLQYILPDVQCGKNVLVVAHGNSMRPILKYLDKLTPEVIAVQEIPFCVPYAYTFNGRQYSRFSL